MGGPSRPTRAGGPRTRLRRGNTIIRRGQRKDALAYRWRLKLEMIAAYGGACRCCGEAHPAFLSLEHTARDGAAHRRVVGDNAQAQLVDLKRQGWPQAGYTVLCLNCNLAAGTWGACPHIWPPGATGPQMRERQRSAAAAVPLPAEQPQAAVA